MDVYKKTMLGCKYEREANDFAHALLTDGREALTWSLEVADYFGMPEKFARIQGAASAGFRCLLIMGGHLRGVAVSVCTL